MVQTLVSSTTTYCPVAEFLKRVDKTAIGKLASDTTTPVPAVSLPTDPNVVAALMDGSGLFESAVIRGGKYSAEDLQLLSATDCVARGLMYRIISDVTWAFMFERRPNMNVPMPPTMQRSLLWLESLGKGEKIFAFAEAVDATIMHKSDATDQDLIDRNGTVQKARAYYGQIQDY